MITKLQDRVNYTKENVKGGIGPIDFKEIVSSKQLSSKIKMLSTLTYPKGSGIGYHTHVGESEAVVIIKGKGIVNDDGNEYEVNVGDVNVCFENHYHSIRNESDEDLQIVALVIEKDN